MRHATASFTKVEVGCSTGPAIIGRFAGYADVMVNVAVGPEDAITAADRAVACRDGFGWCIEVPSDAPAVADPLHLEDSFR